MDEHTWSPDGEPPARLAAVLDAARRPGDAGELAGEAAARAAFREHHRTQSLRRRRALSKGFSVKAAIAAAGAFSVVGVAAAATDNLPGSLGAAAHGAAAGSVASERAGGPDQAARLGLCEAAGRSAAAAERGPAADALATLAGGAGQVEAYCAEVAAGTRGGPSSAGAGPDVLGPAGTGLCRAWQAGRGGEQGGRGGEKGGRELAVAFAALARAAGGSDRIDAYCTASPAAPSRAAGPSHPATSSPSRHAPAATPSHPNGPRATGGPGTRPAPAPTAPPGREPTGTP
jgi:hypothetical protein